MSKSTRKSKSNKSKSKQSQKRSYAHGGKRNQKNNGGQRSPRAIMTNLRDVKGSTQMEKCGQLGTWVDFGGMDSFATATLYIHPVRGKVTILTISVQSDRPDLRNELIFEPVGVVGYWFTQADLDSWIYDLYDDETYYQETLKPVTHQINGVTWTPLTDQKGLTVPLTTPTA